MDQETRKRKLEGKDTEAIIHTRKRTRQEVEKEIARNVTDTSRLQLLEDIPTPEGVQVFTPGAEASSTSIALREVCTSNLPSVQLQRDIGALIVKNYQIFGSDAFQTVGNQMTQILSTLNMSDQSSIQLKIRNNPPFAARLLQMALGNTVNIATSSSFRYRSSEIMAPFTSCFPPDDIEDNGILYSHVPEKFDMQLGLQVLLHYFINFTNNDALFIRQIHEGVQWLLTNLGESFLSDLFSHETSAVKTFMRKIFPAVVTHGNIKVAKCILEGHIDILNLTTYRHRCYSYTTQEECMSRAVTNGDSSMVELLCRAGFSPQIVSHFSLPDPELLWDTRNLKTLQTLLSSGAHPECFIVSRPRGFPLIDAAKSGSIEAVNMLLMKEGSRVNVYVKDYYGTALQAAVWAGHLEMAEFLIARRADINAPSGTQYQIPTRDDCISGPRILAPWSMKTPIQIACAKNNVPLAELLLNHGADVNLSPLSQIDSGAYKKHSMFSHCDEDCGPIDYSPHCNEMQHLTALQHSVQNGNTNLVRLLLSSGANPNLRAVPNWEDTPLQLSIRLDYPEIARVLIEAGANVNASPGEYNGRTTLQAAAESGNIQIAQVLLGRGADINAPPGYEKGLTALQAAIKMGHPLMAGFLCILGANINAPPAPEKGLTAIQAAAEIGDLNLMNELMRWGADMNNETAGNRAILASISHKSLPMLKLLVKHGVPINGQEKNDDMPPILASAMNEWTDGVRYLLDNGADINSYYDHEDTDPDGILSVLAWSIINEDVEMIALLLERGANLHCSSAQKPCDDSLCLALDMNCSMEIIDMLIDEYTKAEPFSLNEEVLAKAVCHEDNSISPMKAKMILNTMSKLPKTLYVAQVMNAWNALSDERDWWPYLDDENTKFANLTIKILLEAGADINSRHPVKGFTLLQVAIRRNEIAIAKFLIEEGAEIQVPASVTIGTPLQEAVKNHETEFAHFLLERDVDINAPPAEDCGATALQAAAKNRNRSLVLTLLERGAEVNAPPAEDGGVTALQAAAIKGYIDIAIDLLQRGALVAAPGAPNHGRTAIDGAAEHGRENMLQLLLNHYDGFEDLKVVCERAATYAEKEGHVEIASWLRRYPDL